MHSSYGLRQDGPRLPARPASCKGEGEAIDPYLCNAGRCVSSLDPLNLDDTDNL